MTGKQRRYLRALAHRLNPTVEVGQRGVTHAVACQVDRALADHELIKVKIRRECPVDRSEAGSLLASGTGCEVAGMIGRVLILYRPRSEDPEIVLPPAYEGTLRGGGAGTESNVLDGERDDGEADGLL